MAGLFGDSENPPVSLAATRWLLVLQGIVLAPLFLQLPIWVLGAYAIVLLYMSLVLAGRISYPGKVLKSVFSVAVVALLVFNYWGQPAVEPMMIFLVLAFVLKMVEMKRRWDFIIVIYIAFIAVCVQLVYSQSMFAALYALFSLFAILVIWGIEYSQGNDRESAMSTWTSLIRLSSLNLKQGLFIFLQAIPIMLVLFFVMPRVGALWALPMPGGGGTTGFSEEMSPGDVSNLAQSDEVAFRVSFDEDTPKDFLVNANFYWRGLVLDQFDGRSWKPNEEDPFLQYRRPSKTPPAQWHADFSVSSEEAISYDIILEPHNQKWLFALNTPITFQSDKKLTGFHSDYQVVDKLKTSARMRYQISSDPTALNDPQGQDWDAIRQSLQLPEEGNPRTRALIAAWRGDTVNGNSVSDRDIARRFLNYITDSFTYTLQPPGLGRDSIDEFLFTTQRGFCEHFSSAFVFAMRQAGIPARVVVGYQGADYVKDEDYYLVRQSNAHAWAEIWLADQGWIRVDPTAAVAPERIEQGLREALQDDDYDLLSAQDRWSASGRGLEGWLANARLQMDVLAYRWHRSVLSYNSDSQQSILNRLLGGNDPWRILIALIAVGALSFVALFASRFIKRRRAVHPLLKSLRPLLKFAEKCGYPRKPQQSVQQLLKALSNHVAAANNPHAEDGNLLLKGNSTALASTESSAYSGSSADSGSSAYSRSSAYSELNADSELRAKPETKAFEQEIARFIQLFERELYQREVDYIRIYNISKKAVAKLKALLPSTR